MRFRARVAATVALASTLVASAALAATPAEVRDVARVKEWSGSSIDGWLAWEANSRSHPHVFKVYVKPDASTRRRVPLGGTSRWPTLIATGPRAGLVVFQATDLHRGDIRFYDPVTEAVLRVPRSINTAAREDLPESDGDHLTFERIRASGPDTILYTFSTKTSAVVGHRMVPGQVNGDYAVYFRCSSTSCDVKRYRISAGRITTVPAASSGRANYWPAVMPDGTTYYVEGSRAKCGRDTKILRFHAGTVTTVATMPDGIEVAGLEARSVNGADQLLLTEVTCSRDGQVSDSGIYALAI